MAKNPRSGNRRNRPKPGPKPRPKPGPKPGPKPNRPRSTIDIVDIAVTVQTLLDQLSGKKPSSAEPNELQTYSDLLEKELAKEKPDKELIAALLKKIKEGTAPSGS